MFTLNWPQVNTWRLSQHHLLQRAAPQTLLKVVTQIGGVHAQLMSAAELALWARIADISAADVQKALWQDRTLTKTWAMRGTLHLLTTTEFPLYIAARSAYLIRRPPSYYKYHGVTPAELAAILENIPEILSDTPMTREQLAAAMAERTDAPQLREVLLSGWGALLKPSAFQGDLCFGPSQGRQVTFVQPNQWLGAGQPVEAPQTALQEIARRYLAAYGPATSDEFARWWGITAGQAKKLFRSLGDELIAVEVAGWEASLLTTSLEPLKALKPAASIRLLPHFDPYTVAVARHSQYLLPEQHRPRVYRSQGWISPVVLVDGQIEGVWGYDKQATYIEVKVEMFTSLKDKVKQGIATEVAQLGHFLEAEVQIIYP